jgi:hypothetical protein
MSEFPIRLACYICDTDVCDGVAEIPTTWSDVQEVQSLDDSRRRNLAEDASGWPSQSYTHLGLCPACQQLDRPPAGGYCGYGA